MSVEKKMSRYGLDSAEEELHGLIPRANYTDRATAAWIQLAKYKIHWRSLMLMNLRTLLNAEKFPNQLLRTSEERLYPMQISFLCLSV
jgi:hypothetical protein